ncbi:Hypothetical predicted protein [Podarcis lilfordi]|uniref:Uncharacterized protein n=1 Tax=Podarcis lilfordi TaxID=74358 RepID=A0AA35P7E8_9SAUR|nr:Hypothetical predicted protein [Podarcis lilfordi]
MPTRVPPPRSSTAPRADSEFPPPGPAPAAFTSARATEEEEEAGLLFSSASIPRRAAGSRASRDTTENHLRNTQK